MKKTHIALGLLLTALATSAVAQAVPQESRAFEVDATLVPNIPATGENTLEFTLQEGDKPVAGLKLTSAVGMTNMDMGVAHPTVAEPDPGHYVVKPDLQMKGPWRVTIRCKDPKFKLDFDLEAGSKEPWQFKKRTFRVPQMEEPMEGMSHPATSSIPTLKEKETYEVKGGEDWDIRTGFGKNLGMVQMMLLMMVTGSGMEGMKMPPMNIVFNDASFQESDATQTGSRTPPRSPSRPRKETPSKVPR